MQFNIITKESQVVKGIFKTFLTFFEKISSERKIMVFFRRKIGLFAVRKSVAEKKEAPHGRASSAIINYVDIEPRFFLFRRRFSSCGSLDFTLFPSSFQGENFSVFLMLFVAFSGAFWGDFRPFFRLDGLVFDLLYQPRSALFSLIIPSTTLALVVAKLILRKRLPHSP